MGQNQCALVSGQVKNINGLWKMIALLNLSQIVNSVSINQHGIAQKLV